MIFVGQLSRQQLSQFVLEGAGRLHLLWFNEHPELRMQAAVLVGQVVKVDGKEVTDGQYTPKIEVASIRVKE